MPCLLRLCTPWGVVAISERYAGVSPRLSLHFSNLSGIQPSPPHLSIQGVLVHLAPSSRTTDFQRMSPFKPRPARDETFYFILIDLSRTWDFQRGKRGGKTPQAFQVIPTPIQKETGPRSAEIPVHRRPISPRPQSTHLF